MIGSMSCDIHHGGKIQRTFEDPSWKICLHNRGGASLPFFTRRSSAYDWWHIGNKQTSQERWKGWKTVGNHPTETKLSLPESVFCFTVNLSTTVNDNVSRTKLTGDEFR